MRRFLAIYSLFGIVLFLFLFRIPLKETAQNFLKPALPPAKEAADFKKTVQNDLLARHTPRTQPKKEVPQSPEDRTAAQPSEFEGLSINLRMPFASQAPFGNWDFPYKEACEEASMVMVERYFNDKPLSAAIMNEEILKLVEWENQRFGDYKDTDAAQMAETLRDYFGISARVRRDFTKDDIKRALLQGNPVILPVAGRRLGNPYFRSPGPLYHVLVVKGFIGDTFITNDPGTRRGADFLYEEDHLMDVINDWNPKGMIYGGKAMIVVEKS